MALIYVDGDNQCHPTQNDDNTWVEIDSPFFDGKCKVFIEGYACVPVEGGEKVYPIGNPTVLALAQNIYADALATARAEYEAAITDTQLAVAELYESVAPALDSAQVSAQQTQASAAVQTQEEEAANG